MSIVITLNISYLKTVSTFSYVLKVDTVFNRNTYLFGMFYGRN